MSNNEFYMLVRINDRNRVGDISQLVKPMSVFEQDLKVNKMQLDNVRFKDQFRIEVELPKALSIF